MSAPELRVAPMSSSRSTETTASSPFSGDQKFVAKSGAWLFAVSALFGGYAAGGLSGQIPIDGKMALGAHVTGLISALLLFAYAWTMPMLSYGEVGRKRLAWALIVSGFANLFIGSAKAIPAVHGIALTGDAANNVVFGLLNLFVVLPVLAGGFAWAWGFREKK